MAYRWESVENHLRSEIVEILRLRPAMCVAYSFVYDKEKHLSYKNQKVQLKKNSISCRYCG